MQMNNCKKGENEIEVKLERLQTYLISLNTSISENEINLNEEDIQSIERRQNQLESCLDNLLEEVDFQSNLRMRLTKLKQELKSSQSRIYRIKNQRHLEQDNDNCEHNVYEKEANLMMMEQLQNNEGIAQLAKEVKEKAEVSQQLERDIRDIEAIFCDLNHIVHEQGEMVDCIEESVENASNDVMRGQRELKKAMEHKGRNTAMTAAVAG
ncbi:syx-17, partial [Pristionchus pacificus]